MKSTPLLSVLFVTLFVGSDSTAKRTATLGLGIEFLNAKFKCTIQL